jgi:hypothetical protein
MTRLTHGHAARSVRGQPTAEYRIWCNMHRRCKPNVKNYGARGISVCERWTSFENFVADMGPMPSAHHSLDRKCVEGNYEPGNCRWATKTEQMRNTRANRLIEHNGKTQPLAAWAEEIGMSQDTLRVRLHRGKSIERVLSTNKHTRAS